MRIQEDFIDSFLKNEICELHTDVQISRILSKEVATMVDKSLIIQFLQTSTSQSISEKELIRRLHIESDDRHEFKKLLRELIASGEVIEVKKDKIGTPPDVGNNPPDDGFEPKPAMRAPGGPCAMQKTNSLADVRLSC